MLDCLQAGDLESLEEFETLFKGAKFHKGLEMVFTNTQTGALALRIQDEEVSCCTLACQHNLKMYHPPPGACKPCLPSGIVRRPYARLVAVIQQSVVCFLLARCERISCGHFSQLQYVQVGTVDSPVFTQAFFDLYLGADPVSKDGKASIVKGIARTVSRAGY